MVEGEKGIMGVPRAMQRLLLLLRRRRRRRRHQQRRWAVPLALLQQTGVGQRQGW